MPEFSQKFIIQVICLALFFLLEGIWPFFERGVERYKHGVKNLLLASVNGAIGAVVFAALIVASINWAAEQHFGVLNWLALPTVLRIPLAVILFDLWMYLWHLLNHLVPFLWRFHRLHHSDEAMDVTTGLRFHPLEIALSFLARLIVIPLLGISFAELILYESILQLVVLFHHSNIDLPQRWDRVLRIVIVSPNMHRVHHSKIVKETNSNYSSIFSWWDRIFKTHLNREDVRNISYGL